MKKVIAAAVLALSPFVALAQYRVTNAGTLFDTVSKILNSVIVILISLAVVWLIYGVFKYMIAGDEEEKKKGKSIVIYGVIALFVMISVWGLVRILVNTFGLENQQIRKQELPSVPPLR
jgi:hypothetical protein